MFSYNEKITVRKHLLALLFWGWCVVMLAVFGLVAYYEDMPHIFYAFLASWPGTLVGAVCDRFVLFIEHIGYPCFAGIGTYFYWKRFLRVIRNGSLALVVILTTLHVAFSYLLCVYGGYEKEYSALHFLLVGIFICFIVLLRLYLVEKRGAERHEE